MHSAYYDRTTADNQAVLLVDSLQKEFLVPSSSLPSGSKQGTWFLVTIQDNAITSIQIDEDKTTRMHSEIQNRLARLQSKKKSRFKRH